MSLFLTCTVSVVVLVALFLLGLSCVTKGRYVRKDIIMAILVGVFAVEACLSVAGLLPSFLGNKIVGITIIVVMVPMILLKQRSRKFSKWLETRI